jgi:SAM-dependent methyltransferase
LSKSDAEWQSEMMIDPKKLSAEWSVEELCSTADQYFKSLADPTPWMIKPFSSLLEAPELLHNVGLLLSGLHLGKTMTVLDFGAGSCWLSRMLSQLRCKVIACDVSPTALDIGKRLFTELPILGEGLFRPRFLPFNGRQIDLPDSSVDRITCNDAFHHVPNQQEVLSEFARILRPGGMAGFSEPGREHSRKPQSQLEMRNHGVFENDIDLPEIFVIARQAGFTHISCKLLNNMELSLEEYDVLLPGKDESPHDQSAATAALATRVMANTRQTTADRTIFFLRKGDFCLDSRSHVGLAHTLEIDLRETKVARGEVANVQLFIRNSGSARWLTENVHGVGVVKVGTHLYDEEGRLLNFDFTRHSFAHDILPGRSVQVEAVIKFETRGRYRLAFDLVSEQVIWFENLGSQPRELVVDVI